VHLEFQDSTWRILDLNFFRIDGLKGLETRNENACPSDSLLLQYYDFTDPLRIILYWDLLLLKEIDFRHFFREVVFVPFLETHAMRWETKFAIYMWQLHFLVLALLFAAFELFLPVYFASHDYIQTCRQLHPLRHCSSVAWLNQFYF
jgi:hypothetical protein